MRDFREICKTLFLCIAAVNLGVSSGLVFLGILFAIGFLYIHVKSQNVPYRKLFAYGAIVPCALWWTVTPGVDYGVSPYIVFIPGWYLLFLAWLQKRSLGKGGYEVFVVFDGVAALLMGMFQAPRPCVWLGVAGLLLALHAYSRPKTALYKNLLFLMLLVGFGGASFGGWQYWKNHRHYSGRWADDYNERTRVMGFDAVAALGSFGSNYRSRYNEQVVLRVWDTLAPEYMRAAVYEKYLAGIWKLPPKPSQKLYSAYYNVDYAVFESKDSSTRAANVRAVWVQAALDNFGFFFAAPNAVGVAAKNTDSLDYYSTNVFAGANGNRSDWYYYVGESLSLKDENLDSAFLQIGSRYADFVDTVVLAMGITGDSLDDVGKVSKVKNYFAQNFRYSLQIPGLERKFFHGGAGGRDPLMVFWNAKEGYCEYYATLAALALRRVGIPTRYVTGFAHPERVSGRPYVLYRRLHSHAWLEVLVDGEWFPFDPTPPIPVVGLQGESWFKMKWEGVKGRFSYIFHLLKDGQWRQTVDGWQSYSDRILNSPLFYGILAMMVLAVLFLKFRGRKRTRKNVVSDDALLWVARLNKAEKIVASYGWLRAPGETVSAFSVRIENGLKLSGERLTSESGSRINRWKKQKAACEAALLEFARYEANRWK